MKRVKDLFLKEDQDDANKELNCYGYCLDNAIGHYLNAEFAKAAINFENVARSLHELQTLKNRKEMEEKAWLLLKQMKSEKEQVIMLNRLSDKQERSRRAWY